MNKSTTNRLDRIQAAMPDRTEVPVPKVPPGFDGTLLYNSNVTVWLPDNGRGPVDQPKPNIVRIPD